MWSVPVGCTRHIFVERPYLSTTSVARVQLLPLLMPALAVL